MDILVDLAGKMHAILGRDWFDLLWFIQRKIPIRLQYLEEN